MRSKKFGNKWVVRIDKGEEIVETIKLICKKNKIKLGTVNGIGGIEKVIVGAFKAKTKEYFSQELIGDYEIASLIGNISTMKGETYLHLHITITDSKNNAFGGHLNSAMISTTGEFIIEEIKGNIGRKYNDEVKLNLLFDE